MTRFRRAALALALAIVVVLALFALYSRGPVWLLLMILTMVGAVLMMRPPRSSGSQTRKRK